MTKTIISLSLLTPVLLLQPGCSLGEGNACDETEFKCDPTGGTTEVDDTGDTDSDADTDIDADTDTDSGTEDTAYRQDDPGDYVEIFPESEYVPLIDASGDSNRDQQFFAVVVNTTDEELGFRLSYSSSGEDSSSGPGSDTGAVTREPTDSEKPPEGPSAGAAGSASGTWTPPDFFFEARGLPTPGSEGAAAKGGTGTTDTATTCDDVCLDVGGCEDEFNVRADFAENDVYDTVAATLWAVGETVLIYVDDRAPIDWDYDCDGEIDAPASNPAYGFDNCDLETVADIVDTNIVVNFRDIFGDESDINGDCRISVLISPVLNEIPRSSLDEDDFASIIESYADPAVDLDDNHYEFNPGSDEQEIIYVFAPDPHGFYNPQKTASVEEYTSQELVGQIARGLYKLISYNHHVIVSGGAAEDDWVVESMAAVGSDIVGFGATYHDDAWTYLDAPNASPMTPLATSDAEIFFSTSARGAEYLWGLWIMEKYGVQILEGITQSGQVGQDSIEAAISGLGTGESAEFDDLVLDFHVALLGSGVLKDSDGSDLLDGEWTQFAEATNLTAPTTPPTDGGPGQYYGANGYQTGFNVRGINSYFEDGTTANPSENLSRRVVTTGSDFQTYVTGFPFYGYTIGGHSAFVTRLVDVPYDSAFLEIQGGTSKILGAVIRWNDLVEEDFSVEQIYSPMDVNAVALPALPSDGTEIYALGEITESATSSILDAQGNTDVADVEDTDRWLLDLTDRPSSAVVSMAIWLERKFENADGDASPYDPWLAIVPEDVVPTPNVDDYHYDVTCPTADYWAYPSLTIASVFAQNFLSSSPGVALETDIGDQEDSVYCGTVGASEETGDTGADGLACDEDWDGDGISESNEPKPKTFADQVLVQQCTNNGGTMEGVVKLTADAFDGDERDDDDTVSYSTVYNVGGTATDSGEEALLYATLTGGQRYLLVVGGGGDTGYYELSMRQLN